MRKAAKLAEKKRKEDEATLALLYKPVLVQQPVFQQGAAGGADPKSILCVHFKAGICARGAKCKFSHDLDLVRKSGKLNIYEDPRKKKEAETMESWTQEQLEKAVAEKSHRPANATDIICKFFLEALEKKKYGWRWECPNGRDCKYRHELPPGYILKSDEKRMAEIEADEEGPTVEETIEEMRKKLDLSKCTPLTKELLAQWKVKRKAQREVEGEKKRKHEAEKKGQKNIQMTGRALFKFDPSLFVDDADAAGGEELEVRTERWEEEEEEERKRAEEAKANREAGEGDTAEEEEEEEPRSAVPQESKEERKERPDEKLAKAIDEDLFLDDGDLPDEDE